MVNDDCIFCKLANGVFETNTLYEDDDFRVIFEVFVLVKKIATVLKEVTGCEGVNILQNNGEIAGQTVFHFHMHIIPRYKGDTANIKWVQNEVDQAVVDEIISKAKDLL